MKQHNQVAGRKCWQTKRERDRLKARFQIRERVANSQSALQSPVDFNSALINQLLSSILKGDRSKFSVKLIDQNFSILSARIPIFYIQEKLPHALQLCFAWFGKEYADELETYINLLETFTFMEFAVWVGKYTIVGAFLVGGINPCIRGYCSDDNKDVDNHEWEQYVGSQVLRRLFDCFPLPLLSYIVKRIVDLRRKAASDSPASPATCRCCTLCGSSSLQQSLCLTVTRTCDHSICEPCLWKDVVENIDSYGDLPDVFICPVCRSADSEVKPTRMHELVPQVEKIKSLSPRDRASYSLTQLHALPENRQALKSSTQKKKKAKEEDGIASTWHGAVCGSLGLSQEVRRDKFFSYVEKHAFHYVRGCLFAGVNVNWTNEYGQTALYISIWRGCLDIARLLLEFGANPLISANGGSTVSSICICRGYHDILRAIQDVVAPTAPDEEEAAVATSPLRDLEGTNAVDMSLATLIPKADEHPGAGSFTIDHVLSASQIECLLNLHRNLPIEAAQKKNNALCSERSYFSDSEGYICNLLEEAIYKVGLASQDEAPCKVFPHMRFLNYTRPGAILAPHVDLCRVDPFSAKRSTHTLILYLTTCDSGGETSLLTEVARNSKVLATVSVMRGRMLLFPHSCPHQGNEVVDAPKILLRGELMLEG